MEHSIPWEADSRPVCLASLKLNNQHQAHDFPSLVYVLSHVKTVQNQHL